MKTQLDDSAIRKIFKDNEKTIEEIRMLVADIETLREMEKNGIYYKFNEAEEAFECPICGAFVKETEVFGKHLIECYKKAGSLNRFDQTARSAKDTAPMYAA